MNSMWNHRYNFSTYIRVCLNVYCTFIASLQNCFVTFKIIYVMTYTSQTVIFYISCSLYQYVYINVVV